MAGNRRPAKPEVPDIEITAGAEVRELRFQNAPHAESFPKSPDHEDYSSGGERQNLPEPVQEGVSYHDISVRWKGVARIKKTPREEE